MKRIEIIFFLLFCMAFLPIDLSAQNKYNNALNNFLQTKGIQPSTTSICVKDFSGKNIVAHNIDMPLAPASTLKTITTATGLEILGPYFKYKTYLGTNHYKNLLIIKGTGDPTLGSIYNERGTQKNNAEQNSFLTQWVTAVKNHFFNNSTAVSPVNILIDDSYFGYQGISRDWIYEDIGNYYACGVYGISIFDNTYRLVLNTENEQRAPKILYVQPKIKDLTFTNLLEYNSTNQDNAFITTFPMSYQATLIGDVPAGRKTFTMKGAIPNPGQTLGEAVSEKLNEIGIKVESIQTSKNFFLQNRFSQDTILYKTFYTHESMPLSSICRIINTVSNNQYAECLIRTIGVFSNNERKDQSLQAGIELIKNYWMQKGIDSQELRMSDGCGLAPANAVSTNFISSMLVYMQTESKHKNSYLQSFPIAGRDGTVKNFMKDALFSGCLYVKSGSISGVQAYSGYYIKGERKLAFSIMVNQFIGHRRNIVKAIEELLKEILY